MSDESEVPPEPVDGRRRRRGLSMALVVVAAVIMLFTALGTWVKRQALDTDNWVSASSEMLEDPTIRAALSEYLVNELYQAVDVRAQIADQLPEQLQGLAGPLAGALARTGGPRRRPAARHLTGPGRVGRCQPHRPHHVEADPRGRYTRRGLHGRWQGDARRASADPAAR